MNYFEERKKKFAEVKTKEPQTDPKKENMYRLLELYINQYEKATLLNEKFDFDKIKNTFSYKTFKREYEKKINCNICSFLTTDESTILFDTLIDLEEIFTDFRRDEFIKNKQLEHFCIKKRKVTIIKSEVLKERNLLFLIEKFNMFKVGSITKEELLESSYYDSFFKEANGKKNLMIHDKCSVYNKLLNLYNNELFISNDRKRSFVK